MKRQLAALFPDVDSAEVPGIRLDRDVTIHGDGKTPTKLVQFTMPGKKPVQVTIPAPLAQVTIRPKMGAAYCVGKIAAAYDFSKISAVYVSSTIGSS